MVKNTVCGLLVALVGLTLPSGPSPSVADEQTAEGGPASNERNHDFVNSIGMKLMPISAGEFMMGGNVNDSFASKSEFPQHRVKISQSFFMSAYELTDNQYFSVMPGSVPRGNSGLGPILGRSWNQANEFCKKLSALPEERRLGRTYRLPTEAEWEYACRAGTSSIYHFGNDFSSLNEYVHSSYPAANVGTKKPNAWGLYDMQGNLTEWCSDWYAEDYYKTSPSADPQGPASGSGRVHRGDPGGSNSKSTFRSSMRAKLGPDQNYPTLGIRVVCEVQ